MSVSRTSLSLVALLVWGASGQPLNVSLIPSSFWDGALRKMMIKYGGWSPEARCDKYIYSRAWDASCMKKRPPAGELLPLLVTGTPSIGSRALTELFEELGIGADHEAYGARATVSWAHAVNEFVAGTAYPHSSERTRWWDTRIISNRFDFQNVFRPRFARVVHVTRCPTRVLASLMASSAPTARFVEAFSRRPALTSPCATTYARGPGPDFVTCVFRVLERVSRSLNLETF